VGGARRAIVMEIERGFGYAPVDRELEKLGYDVGMWCRGRAACGSSKPKAGCHAETITVTKNEILSSFNKPDDFILAVVEFFMATSTRSLPSTPVPRAGITTEFSGATVDFPFRLIAEGAVPS
jgi:hypothetical protein